MSWIKKCGASLQGFGRTILRSCYDMEWYRQVRTRPPGRAFVYLLKFNLLLSLLTMLLLLPAAFSAWDEVREYVISRVPAGTEIGIKDGRLSTNLPAPYDIGVEETPVLIDSSATGTDFPADLPEGEALVIGRDAIFFIAEAERRVYELREFPDFQVTRDSALALLDAWGVPVVLLLVLLFGLTYYISFLIGITGFAILGAAVAWLIAKLLKTPLRYGQWLAVGLHAITLPTLINAVFAAFGVQVPFVTTVIFFMFVAAVLADERARPTSKPAAGSAPPPKPPPPPPEKK